MEDYMRRKSEEEKILKQTTGYQQLSKSTEVGIHEEEKLTRGMPKRKDSKFDLQRKAVMRRPSFARKDRPKGEKLWEIMGNYLSSDIDAIQKQIVNHIEYTLALNRFNFDNSGCYYAAAYSLRDRLIESWNDTNLHMYKLDPKRVYYLSLEYLLGRMLQSSLVNLDLEDKYREAMDDLGYRLEDVYEEEADPGLGNGGLGRLAACFMDSMATLNLPAWGYGIRYSYGIFSQEIHDGHQVELPDYWLSRGNPWEIERNDVRVNVQFYGKVEKYDDNGTERKKWVGEERVQAMAYDNPMPGYNTFNTNNLRLWRACPSTEFDFRSFNAGDYFGAVRAKQKAETISSVLYPNDMSMEGKELRLKQEYFFCSATLHDIVRRFQKKRSHSWKNFADKVAIQLNDTHPAIAVIELLRLLIDDHKLPYDQAMSMVEGTFAYTNHTILQEALERWDVGLMQRLLPRHMELITLMNNQFLETLEKVFPGNAEMRKSLSFIEEGEHPRVRMANICVAICHNVNGVAALHTEIIKKALFKDFSDYFNKFDGGKHKDKFVNITNGATPRRWIVCANPEMTELINQWLGTDEWITDLDKLRGIEKFANDPEKINEWAMVKREKKKRLAGLIKKLTGIDVSVDVLFDVMVKRIHEYKRQLMNALYVVYRYFWLKEMSAEDRKKVTPRVVVMGGKSAPGYENAKRIIKLVHNIGNVVNKDPDTKDLLKFVFLPNYSVSMAQVIIPGAELSQHISTAGLEASGTSNMKFQMNGCLIIGTLDGANVEIAEEVGKENMFIFGATVEQVAKFRQEMSKGNCEYVPDKLRKVLDSIIGGKFGDLSDMHKMLNDLKEGGDYYCLCWDFESYVEAQTRVDECYKNQQEWNKRSIISTARSGKFSTDRNIREYASKIWLAFFVWLLTENRNATPMPIPRPATAPLGAIPEKKGSIHNY
jgi:starch phosphorylase